MMLEEKPVLTIGQNETVEFEIVGPPSLYPVPMPTFGKMATRVLLPVLFDGEFRLLSLPKMAWKDLKAAVMEVIDSGKKPRRRRLWKAHRDGHSDIVGVGPCQITRQGSVLETTYTAKCGPIASSVKR